jgi:hypothetical protein
VPGVASFAGPRRLICRVCRSYRSRKIHNFAAAVSLLRPCFGKHPARWARPSVRDSAFLKNTCRTCATRHCPLQRHHPLQHRVRAAVGVKRGAQCPLVSRLSFLGCLSMRGLTHSASSAAKQCMTETCHASPSSPALSFSMAPFAAASRADGRWRQMRGVFLAKQRSFRLTLDTFCSKQSCNCTRP